MIGLLLLCYQIKNTENGYQDKKCKDAGGKCQHYTNKCSSGGYQDDMCDGPSDRKCCGASGGGGNGGDKCGNYGCSYNMDTTGCSSQTGSQDGLVR